MRRSLRATGLSIRPAFSITGGSDESEETDSSHDCVLHRPDGHELPDSQRLADERLSCSAGYVAFHGGHDAQDLGDVDRPGLFCGVVLLRLRAWRGSEAVGDAGNSLWHFDDAIHRHSIGARRIHDLQRAAYSR